MKNFKEWLSSHLLSKSLLSARPFSFFYEETADGELGNQGATDIVSMPTVAVSVRARDDQENGPPDHLQPAVTESSHLAQYSTNDKNIDPLSRVEALQINFLRLVGRIGQSPADPLVAQVLYRLHLASLIRTGESDVRRPALKIDKAIAIAAELETAKQTNLDFSFKILVIGKTGVGKSATINSIFDQPMVATDAFKPGTSQIQEVTGTIKGIKVTVIDTPGLSSCYHNQRRNRRLMFAVKRFIRKSPPDIVLYFDRLNVINRGYSDYQLLKLVTDIFGASIWFNSILVMTHASSPLPEGPDGYPVSYESFVNQCTNLLQHYIHKAVSNTQLQNPVLLVENHPMCRRNTRGEKVLPNSQIWLSQFLLLCIATKALGDANALLRFQDSFQVTKAKTRMPSMPHLLSSLLLPRPSNNEVEDVSDDDEDDYDKLPPIRILTKAQYQKLSKEQRQAYLAELDYRETLYLKNQWKSELRRRREKNDDDNDENNASPEVVQLPDMAIPESFDIECPSYRYRCQLASSDQLLVRPVLNSQGWDHDFGFDGINLELSQDLNRNLNATVMGQMSKDKQEFNIRSECEAKHVNPNGCLILGGINMQTSGKDLVSIVRGDARVKNLGFNTTGGGLSLTSFGKMYFLGAKLEDSVSIGRRFKLTVNAGRVEGQGQAAHGGSVEATVRGRDHPVRDEKVTLAATLVSADKETVLGGSLKADFRVGRDGKMSVDASLNSKRLGQLNMKFSSSEHVQIGLIMVVSLLQGLFRGKAKETLGSDG